MMKNLSCVTVSPCGWKYKCHASQQLNCTASLCLLCNEHAQRSKLAPVYDARNLIGLYSALQSWRWVRKSYTSCTDQVVLYSTVDFIEWLISIIFSGLNVKRLISRPLLKQLIQEAKPFDMLNSLYDWNFNVKNKWIQHVWHPDPSPQPVLYRFCHVIEWNIWIQQI